MVGDLSVAKAFIVEKVRPTCVGIGELITLQRRISTIVIKSLVITVMSIKR